MNHARRADELFVFYMPTKNLSLTLFFADRWRDSFISTPAPWERAKRRLAAMQHQFCSNSSAANQQLNVCTSCVLLGGAGFVELGTLVQMKTKLAFITGEFSGLRALMYFPSTTLLPMVYDEGEQQRPPSSGGAASRSTARRAEIWIPRIELGRQDATRSGGDAAVPPQTDSKRTAVSAAYIRVCFFLFVDPLARPPIYRCVF